MCNTLKNTVKIILYSYFINLQFIIFKVKKKKVFFTIHVFFATFAELKKRYG